MAVGIPVGYVDGADEGRIREVMQEHVEKELQIINGEGTTYQNRGCISNIIRKCWWVRGWRKKEEEYETHEMFYYQ